MALLRGSVNPRGLLPLPGTRREVEAIGTHRLLGKEATPAGLLEPHGAGAAGAPFIWHVTASWIRRARNFRLSPLTPSAHDDGFLTCLDIFAMHIPADLVVLSACDTGRGKVYQAEGIVGLMRAFMVAGAPRVLCSLWKVDDEATRALMTKFYALWNPKDGSPGLGAAAALKAAQAHVKAQEEWTHPHYWAGWVLWGLP